MSQTQPLKKTISLSERIQLLGQDHDEVENEQNLLQIDKSTFTKKSSRINSNSSLKSHSNFDENQFKIYALSSKKGLRNLHSALNNESNPLSILINKQENKLTKSKTSRPSKKRSGSGILLGFKKGDQVEAQDIVKDFYQQYLTMEEIQARKAREKLEKKIQKFMPKNSSFTQFYGEKIRMVEKQAQREEKEIHKEIFADGVEDKAHKEKEKKRLLSEILQNKTINFKNKLRSRSFQKERQTPQISIMESIQRQNTMDHINVMNSPTFSDASSLKQRFQFFPEPKNMRFSRFANSYNNTITPSRVISSIASNPQSQCPSQQYLQTIRTLQQVSQRETKRSQYLISISKKKQEEFEKTYDDLNDQTLEAIYGFTVTKLEEQTSSSFKDQLREMWMNNDINKGKPKRNSLRANRQRAQFL